jgi:excisionase family DNA binding protein
MSDNLKDLITPAEAARIRGVTRQTIAHLIARQRFTTTEIGGRLFLHRSEVENYEPDRGGRPPKAKAPDAAKPAGKHGPKEGSKK